MSIQFNDTTAYKGLVQLYEKDIAVARGVISGDTNKLKEFTADCNIAFDDFLHLAFNSSGTWQYDDSNHTDFPIITTNLVASQRDYTFTNDESGNLIIDIHRVFVRNSTTDPYFEIHPVDVQTDNEGIISEIADGLNSEGTPYRYEKTGNGIFLDPIPDTSVTNGLKLYINREASYFISTDTTKKPGVPGILHAWFYKKPAYEYAKRHLLSNVNVLREDVQLLEEKIKDYFSHRERDKRHIMTPKKSLFI